MLQWALDEHPSELRADFREYYHINLYDIGPLEAAELIQQLPASSRLLRAAYPENRWPEDYEYLSRIEFWLHVLIWSQSKKSTRGPKPEPLVPESMRDQPSRITGVSMPIEEIDKLFKIKEK